MTGEPGSVWLSYASDLGHELTPHSVDRLQFKERTALCVVNCVCFYRIKTL